MQLYDRLSGTKRGPSWAADDATLTRQLVEAFEGAHAHLKTYKVDEATGEAPGQKSGAAGVAVLLRGGRAIVAHTGDCRAVLGTLTGEFRELTAVDLTDDHKLETQCERDRIEGLGAFIKPAQHEPYFTPARVYADAADRRKGPVSGPTRAAPASLGRPFLTWAAGLS